MHGMTPTALRRRAEAVFQEQVARFPEPPEAMSPDATRHMLHELRVHQIQLEMQNEELRRTQEELKASRTRYFDLYDLAPVGYCTACEQGHILEANLTAATLLGLARTALVKQPIARFILKEDQDIFHRHRTQLLETGEPQSCDLRMARPDGATFRMHLEGSATHEEAGEHVCRIVLSDITERKQVEEALREANDQLRGSIQRAEELAVEAQAATRAKSEFLAVMSHELRTPLNGVLGFAELLSYTPLDAEQKSYAQTISASGKHLLAVVNDILDFSSIEKGHLKLQAAPVAIADIVESSARAARKAAADKGLEFRCKTDPGIPEQIVGDARRISQILINLLGNAIKFTSSGSVVLRVAPASDEGRPALDFSIEDTGLGISPEMLDLLFQPFTQADSTIHRPFEGTGLGLAISRRLAEAMGGSISVVSTPGKGSTFTFHLPLEISAGGMASVPSHLFMGADGASPSSPSAGTPMPPENKLVLVVEDDPDNSLLAGKMLQSLGYRVEFAADGAEAVATFAPGKYFAILMDMRLPVMDGLAATRKIREHGARVPIIALTANVMPGDRECCLADGMDDYLLKPFKRAELAAKLARFTQP
jgi:PAS domain S-box-containing protein